MKKTLYLECNSGISGDMTVGALLDLGADRKVLEDALASLGVDGYHLHFGTTEKCGIKAYDFDVHLEYEEHVHEHCHDHDHEHTHDHGDHDHDHGDHDHDHEHHHHDHDEHDHHHDHEEHEHHHHHDGECDDPECSCHHHHHHADEVFTSWGAETVHSYTEEDIRRILTALDTGDYGAILRAKGIVPSGGKWLHFDYVPEEQDVRYGSADYTGRLCVIGAQLKEDKLKELFSL